MAHFDEDKYSLSQRVARMATEHAWAEDPPSRLRHFITNVRTFECDDPAQLLVESAELLFRSRGDVQRKRPAVVRPRGRAALQRRPRKTLKLARRNIIADESVLRMQNLAVFL